MTYLSFWQAFTYRKATAKNTAVKNNMVTSCMSRSPESRVREFAGHRER
jgi:hypothetical protein